MYDSSHTFILFANINLPIYPHLKFECIERSVSEVSMEKNLHYFYNSSIHAVKSGLVLLVGI